MVRIPLGRLGTEFPSRTKEQGVAGFRDHSRPRKGRERPLLTAGTTGARKLRILLAIH